MLCRENLDRREVKFYLSRDVAGGEELFMDYGRTYDRTKYADASESAMTPMMAGRPNSDSEVLNEDS